MIGRQRLEGFLESSRLLVEDDPRQRGPCQRWQRRIILELCLARRIAALPMMKVRAISDFVFGDSRQPRHDRPRLVSPELADMFE